jgi:type IV secretory pathway TrbL component
LIALPCCAAFAYSPTFT